MTDDLLESEEQDEERGPTTERSPLSKVTARSKVDELLASIKSVAEDLPPDASTQDRVAVLRAAVQPIRLLGQLTGEIGASDATVAASPHYRRLRSAILAALEPFPDALRAVVAALEPLEHGAAPEAA